MKVTNLLKSLIRPQQEPPVQSRDRIPTWHFSADDEPWKPTPELIEVGIEACKRAAEIDLSALQERSNVPPYFDTWPGEQYRLLSALVDVWQPKSVVEIGTFTGLSTLCIKRSMPPGGRIVTFDINGWNTVDITCLTKSDFVDGSVTQILTDLSQPNVAQAHSALLQEAEMIFLDGPHDGSTEASMMRNFLSIKYKRDPLFVFDDIKLSDMLAFWRSLPMPKLDLTSFGHWTGTGIAMLPPHLNEEIQPT